MSRLIAQPLVETQPDGNARHAVTVDLTPVEWRMLVGDIAARVLYLASTGAPIISKLYAAGVRPCDADQQDALSALVGLLEGPTHPGSPHTLPPTWELSPKDASALLVELATALDDPVQCACGRYVEQPSQLTDECGSCTDRADLRLVRGAL